MSDPEPIITALREGRCPDCDGTAFRPGPCGGLNENVECLQCRARFNIARHAGDVVFSQRIETEAEGGSPWPPIIFKKGEHVRAAFEGRTVEAMVVMASANGFSLILSFQAVIDGHVGTMPLLWAGEDYSALITGSRVRITKGE